MAGVLILIIFIAYVYNTNKKVEKLEKENLLLKNEIKKLKENNLNSNTEITQDNTINAIKTEKGKEEAHLTPEEKEKQRIKKKIEEQERKNTSILITGAILIVLAAIVFLLSTWNSIPDILKTSVIILLVGVFLGASKIAKDKFKLEKTSNTFFYIAMAYIPICLISCSIFALFGEYFSIYGPGNYIYLSFVSILTAIIYYINYKKRKSSGLMCACFIAQISSVILFTLIIESSLKLILINLLIYNITILILSMNESIKNTNFVQYMYRTIAYISSIVVIWFLSDISLVITPILILLAINYFLIYMKRKTVLDAYLFNIVLYIIGVYFKFNFQKINISLKLFIEIAYILIVFLIERMILKFYKDENLQKSSMIMSIISVAMVYFECSDYRNIFIKPYMIAIIEEILLIVAFIGSKENGKNILSYLIPCCFALIGCNFIGEIKYTYHYYIIFSIITFVIGEAIKNSKLNKGFFTISHIFLIVTYVNAVLFNQKEFSNDVIYFMILLMIYTYSYMKNKKYKLFKYFTYVAGFLCLQSISVFLELKDDALVLVTLIPTIVITMIEYKFEKNISIDTIFSGIFAFMTIDFYDSDYMREILCLIWSCSHVYIFTSEKSRDVFKVISYILGFCLYNTFLQDLEIVYTAFPMIGITVVALLSSKTVIKKYIKEIDNIEYIVFSLIYLVALTMYTNEKDGMIYVFALVCLVAYSYMQKYGVIFIVTILAIIVNALALTREFWFSIPWWVYLLVVGIVLIAFAMKNESDTNREKISVGNLLKKVKDNIEKL